MGPGGLSLRLWSPKTPTVHLAKVDQKVRFRQGKRPDPGLQLRARSDLGSTAKCPALTFSSKKVKLGVAVSSGGETSYLLVTWLLS